MNPLSPIQPPFSTFPPGGTLQPENYKKESFPQEIKARYNSPISERENQKKEDGKFLIF